MAQDWSLWNPLARTHRSQFLNLPQFGGGKLVIDHPHQFHGEVTLSLPASQLANQPAITRLEIDLQGILNADSYAYDFQKDLLSIYHGNKVLE